MLGVYYDPEAMDDNSDDCTENNKLMFENCLNLCTERALQGLNKRFDADKDPNLAAVSYLIEQQRNGLNPLSKKYSQRYSDQLNPFTPASSLTPAHSFINSHGMNNDDEQDIESDEIDNDQLQILRRINIEETNLSQDSLNHATSIPSSENQSTTSINSNDATL